MTRLQFFRNLHTALWLLVVAVVIAGIGALWWANATGMPETWRRKVEQALENEGMHVSVASLSYQPFHGGLVATEIRVFADPERTRQLSRLERVAIDFDKSLLARGQTKITKFELKDGRLDLPVDPDDPDGEVLEVRHVNAIISRPGGRILEIREASGQIEGIQVSLTARLLGYRPSLESMPADDPNRKARMELLKRFLNEARHWRFDEKNRPRIVISVEGDLADHSSLHGNFRLAATDVEKGGHTLQKISAEGEWTGSLLTLDSLSASDARGSLSGRLDFDLNGREGRFGITSELDLPRLLRSWFGIDIVRDVTLAGEQKIETSGSFHLIDGELPEVQLKGFTSCKALMVKGITFDSLETAFSWDNGNFFLHGLKATRDDGVLTGKLLFKDSQVRAAIRSTMPLAVARPFFEGQPFGRVLNDFTENDLTKVYADLECGFNVRDLHSWTVVGRGKVEHCAYRGTPFLVAETDLDLNHSYLDFKNGAVTFDYRDYSLSRTYQGAKTGSLKVKQVRYDFEADVVEIEKVDGNFWPAPVVRMFAKSVAENLENYRFHQPPSIQGDGKIATAENAHTDLRISFKSQSPAHYEFVGRNLLLQNPSGNVRIQDEKVTVDQLAFNAFDGPVSGRIIRKPDRGGTLEGEFSWTRVSFPGIAALYEFDPKGGGMVTGRIEFTSGTDGVTHLNGKGLVGLEKGELFSVPIFGPLSPLISGVLGDRRAGFQRAKDAFFSYSIQDGVLRTNDFRTATSSLVFTGDARVDLDKLNLDMTMRMNARGLLGVLTLPLRPFYGLFQFHGTGPLRNPEWKNVIFTSPPDDQQETLLNPPKATVIPDP
jgi:hypothetical protein